MMLTLVASVFVLGIMVFVHELGHFLVAKFVGIKVKEFSLGFGPRVTGITKGGTKYNLRLLPLGGFVSMAGMDPNEEAAEADESHGFNKKTVGQRIAVIFAGSFMNFVLAAAIYAVIFAFQGIPAATTVINETLPGYPAISAGLQPGDQIIAINNQRVDEWEQLVDLISALPDQDVSVTVLRDGSEQVFNVHTIEDAEGTGMLGISPVQTYQQLCFAQALGQGVSFTVKVALLLLDFVGKMIVGQEPVDVGGPVMIVSEIGKAAALGFFTLLQLAAFLSINLGIFNLFPIPALDGSRLLFLFIEKLRGRPVDPHKESYFHLVGFALLLLMILIVTYNDILRVWPGQE